jgi:hypothetical protein
MVNNRPGLDRAFGALADPTRRAILERLQGGERATVSELARLFPVSLPVTAAATLNTDFAEIEADVRQVNLSRFPISFPERRDFLLEGARFFEFAPDKASRPFSAGGSGSKGAVRCASLAGCG